MAGSVALPHKLRPVENVLPTSLCTAAVAGLGRSGASVREIVDAGLVPPDVLTGMTLYLLANQPRRARSAAEKRGVIEGGVWDSDARGWR